MNSFGNMYLFIKIVVVVGVVDNDVAKFHKKQTKQTNKQTRLFIFVIKALS